MSFDYFIKTLWAWLMPIRFRHILVPFAAETVEMDVGYTTDTYRVYYIFGIRVAHRCLEKP